MSGYPCKLSHYKNIKEGEDPEQTYLLRHRHRPKVLYNLKQTFPESSNSKRTLFRPDFVWNDVTPARSLIFPEVYLRFFHPFYGLLDENHTSGQIE